MKRISVLQSWRAIFILLIVIEHLALQNRLSVLAAGGEGVSFFLILSGFLTGYIYRRKEFTCSFLGSKEFVLKKLRKFYPLHIVAIILSVILYSYIYLRSNGFEIKGLADIFIKAIVNALFLQVYIPIREWYFNPIHGVGWFLSTIVFCYAFSFVGLAITRKAKEKKKSILMYVLILALFVFFTQIFAGSKLEGFFLYVFPPVRYLEYLLAMIIGYNYEEDFCFFKSRYMASALEVFAVMIFVTNHMLIKQGFYDAHANLKYISIHICSIVLVYVFAKEKGIVSGILNNKGLVYIGDISFYIYIMHHVIIKYVCQIFGWNNKGALVSVVLIAIYALFISKYYDVIIEKIKGKKK